MRKERKHFTPEKKVAILRRHLVDKIPVSELCEELGLRPTVFYRWQKELFENGATQLSWHPVLGLELFLHRPERPLSPGARSWFLRGTYRPGAQRAGLRSLGTAKKQIARSLHLPG